MEKQKVNIKTIAQEADVSIGAVSQALKGTGRLSQKKREEILAIAAKLKYRPNLLVHSIQSGRTNMIGVMMHIGSSFEAKVISGICDRLDQNDYVPLLVKKYSNDLNELAFQIAQLHRLVDRRVDGIMIASSSKELGDKRFMNEFRDFADIPKVTIDQAVPGIGADFVCVDNEAGAAIAVDYLVKCGHRRIAQYAVPTEDTTAIGRREGFEKAAKAQAVEYTSILSSNSWAGALNDIVSVLKSKERPSAVFCATDFLAQRVYAAAEKLSLRIPEDISVIGFANLEFAPYLSPSLTTIDQASYDTGVAAVDLLLERIKGNISGAERIRLMKPKLIVRNSVAILS